MTSLDGGGLVLGAALAAAKRDRLSHISWAREILVKVASSHTTAPSFTTAGCDASASAHANRGLVESAKHRTLEIEPECPSVPAA